MERAEDVYGIALSGRHDSIFDVLMNWTVVTLGWVLKRSNDLVESHAYLSTVHRKRVPIFTP